MSSLSTEEDLTLRKGLGWVKGITSLASTVYTVGAISALSGWKGLATAAIIGVGATAGAGLIGGLAGGLIGGLGMAAVTRSMGGYVLGAICGYTIGMAVAFSPAYDFVKDTVMNGPNSNPDIKEQPAEPKNQTSSVLSDKLNSMTVQGDYNAVALVLSEVTNDNTHTLKVALSKPVWNLGATST